MNQTPKPQSYAIARDILITCCLVAVLYFIGQHIYNLTQDGGKDFKDSTAVIQSDLQKIRQANLEACLSRTSKENCKQYESN